MFSLGVPLQPCSAHPLPPVSIIFSRDTVSVTAADVWKQYWSTAGEAAVRTATLLLSINDAFHGRWYKLLRCEQRPRARKTVMGICTVNIACVLFSLGMGALQNKLKWMYFAGVSWTHVGMLRLGAKGFLISDIAEFQLNGNSLRSKTNLSQGLMCLSCTRFCLYILPEKNLRLYIKVLGCASDMTVQKLDLF